MQPEKELVTSFRPFLFFLAVSMKKTFFWGFVTILSQNVWYPKWFLECIGHSSSYLAKLNSSLELVFGAHVLHIFFPQNFSQWNTLKIDEVSISDLLSIWRYWITCVFKFQFRYLIASYTLEICLQSIFSINLAMTDWGRTADREVQEFEYLKTNRTSSAKLLRLFLQLLSAFLVKYIKIAGTSKESYPDVSLGNCQIFSSFPEEHSISNCFLNIARTCKVFLKFS